MYYELFHLVLLEQLRIETVFLGQPRNTLQHKLSSTLSSGTLDTTSLNQTELNAAFSASGE